MRIYKTGDRHPVHNLLAFVGYCEEGHEIWTSVYGDTEAPYRLAKLNGQRPPCCRHTPDRISGSEVRLPQDEGQPLYSPGVPPDKCQVE